MLTTYGQGQIRSQVQSDAYLTLVTIHTSPVYRLVNNIEDLTSRGNVFTAIPMSFDFSSDDGETIQTIKLNIDNISLEMIDWVRSLTDEVQVTIETVFSGNLDVPEITISNMTIKLIDYDAFTISATLSAADDLNQQIPSDEYTPLQWAGLYDA